MDLIRRTLGHYRIVERIGAGGMGEVYKAIDTRLDRTVAIKVLPADAAADPERRQRFEREARTISSLDHPHICALYDIGRQDGLDFLVMQHLEGETLAARLTRGPLSTDQVVRYATEIADALDRAHRQGITHRDLKPGNIMLTKTGSKLLDFGLAKLKPSSPASTLSALPTQDSPMTAEGTILGTLQYMAPEQLEGKDADSRTDIFAFGAIVYEMMTGRRAFEGASQASLIGAILKDQPQPLSALQPASPPALDDIVRTCLAKDPDDRWQSAGDLRHQLRGISESRSQSDVSSRVAVEPRADARRRLTPWVAGAVIGGIVVGGMMWSLTRPEPPEPRAVARFAIPVPADAPVVTNSTFRQVAISPDGSRIVYVSTFIGTGGLGTTPRLHLRRLDQLDVAPLGGTEGGDQPFFSPDGQWVGFRVGNTLRRVSVLGGSALTIAELDAVPNGMSWTANDTIVFTTVPTEGVKQIPAAGGEVKTLTTVDQKAGEREHRHPAVLPNGKGVLFTVISRDGPRIAMLALDTGMVTPLVEGDSPRYSSTGHIVYGMNGTLRAVGFDAERLAITDGSPVPVVENVYQRFNGEAHHFDLSENGSLAYLSRGVEGGILVWVDRQGREEPVGLPRGKYCEPRVSPDGTRVAFYIQDPNNTDLWVSDLGRPGTLSRITTDPAIDMVTLWSLDSQRIVFQSYREGVPGLFSVSADGRGEVQRLLLGDSPEVSQMLSPESWSADGKQLAFTYNPGLNMGVLSIEDGAWKPLLATPAAEDTLAISPRGGWIAYESNDTGHYEVYVERFPEMGGRVQISAGGGRHPVWSRDERELYYRRADRAVMAAPISSGPKLAASTPRLLFEGRDYALVALGCPGGPRSYDLHPDSKRFLMVKGTTNDASGSSRLVLIQNWHEELKRLVPIP